jgi:hypothetical protein
MTSSITELSGTDEAHRPENGQATPDSARRREWNGCVNSTSVPVIFALWTIEVRRSDGRVIAVAHLRVADSGPDAMRGMVAAGIRVPKGWNVSWDESWRYVAIEPRAA